MKENVLKILAVVLVAIIVSTGGYFVYKKYVSKKTTTASTKYATEKVTKTNLEVTVEATGTVSGVDAINVYSSNSGSLSGMVAKLGDYVKKGDLFCKINDTSAEQAIEKAQITLEHSKLELQALENQLDSLSITAPMDGKVKSVFVAVGDDTASMKSAYGGMAVMTAGADNALELTVAFPSSGGKVAEVHTTAGQSVKKGDILFKMDDTSIQNNIAQKKNDIMSQETSIKNQEEDLAKATITTPISGIITTLNVKNGEQISSGDLKLIATITDTSKMEVTLSVDELDINKVQVGQKATVKIDDIENKSFQGSVQSIAQNGTTSNNVTTYSVVVSIDNPENVKIGMNANVTIKIQSKENALAVPTEALITKNNKKYVMVQDSSQQSSNSNKKGINNVGETKLIEVQTGVKTSSMTEIVSGVSENQTILIELSTSSNSSSSKNKNKQQSGMSGMGGMGGGPGGPPQ